VVIALAVAEAASLVVMMADVTVLSGSYSSVVCAATGSKNYL